MKNVNITFLIRVSTTQPVTCSVSSMALEDTTKVFQRKLREKHHVSDPSSDLENDTF